MNKGIIISIAITSFGCFADSPPNNNVISPPTAPPMVSATPIVSAKPVPDTKPQMLQKQETIQVSKPREQSPDDEASEAALNERLRAILAQDTSTPADAARFKKELEEKWGNEKKASGAARAQQYNICVGHCKALNCGVDHIRCGNCSLSCLH